MLVCRSGAPSGQGAGKRAEEKLGLLRREETLGFFA